MLTPGLMDQILSLLNKWFLTAHPSGLVKYKSQVGTNMDVIFVHCCIFKGPKNILIRFSCVCPGPHCQGQDRDK